LGGETKLNEIPHTIFPSLEESERANRLRILEARLAQIERISLEESERANRLRILEARLAQIERSMLSVENATDPQMLYEVSKAIIVGIREKRSAKEVLDQIKLIIDRESQEAIIEGRKEYEEGRTKSYTNAEDLAKALNESV
jgi:hypothetical protein